jgi:hypothetical protein
MKATMLEEPANGELRELVNRLADTRSPYVSQAEHSPRKSYPNLD